MNRIKNINEVVINGGEVLMRMIERTRESGIILPESSMKDSENSDFGIVVAIGCEITDLEVGDIVLKTRTPEAPGYEYKDDTLLLLNRYAITIAIKPVNFDDNDELAV